jgi:hypothetical protein
VECAMMYVARRCGGSVTQREMSTRAEATW